ncbi:unnamed protein product [Rhodiola kirilowii]
MPNQVVGARFAEVAGGIAADCAVICCCFPCGILNLAILVLYTLPAGLCRRMLRKKQRQKQRLFKKGQVPRRRSCACGCEGGGLPDSQAYAVTRVNEEKEVMRFEKEMWDSFYSSGFWRSHSQREN